MAHAVTTSSLPQGDPPTDGASAASAPRRPAVVRGAAAVARALSALGVFLADLRVPAIAFAVGASIGAGTSLTLASCTSCATGPITLEIALLSGAVAAWAARSAQNQLAGR